MTTEFDPEIAFRYGSVVETAYRLFSPGLLAPEATAAALPPEPAGLPGIVRLAVHP